MYKNIFIYISIIYCGFILESEQILADTIYLKNGNAIKGIVLESDKDMIYLRVRSGRLSFPKEYIENIEYSLESDKVQLQQFGQDEQKQEEKKIKTVSAQEEKKEEVFLEKEPEQVITPLPEVINSAITAPLNNKKNKQAIKVSRKELGNTYYELCLPPDYDECKKWPLIIGLHGYTVKPEDFMQYWKFESKRRGVIVICPKSIDKGWQLQDVSNIFKLIEDVKKHYSIAPDKIFLTGFSSGANFVLYLGLSYPERFKGIAAIAGSIAKARNLIGTISCSYIKSKHLPILIYIGEKDEEKRRIYALETNNELSRFGYPVTYKVIPKVAHTYMSWYSKEIGAWFNAISQ